MRTQFNLSDFISAMLIIGAFPVMLSWRSNFPALVFVLGVFFEIPALIWGAELCRSWKMKNFIACLCVHLYAFAASIGSFSFPVCCLLLLMMLLSKSDFTQGDLGELLIWCIATGALAASVVILERKRRRLPK